MITTLDLKPTPKLRQEFYQVVFDKLSGVDFPEGDQFEEVIGREIDRAYAWVCNRLKTSLSPVRKTDLPGSPEAIYKDKVRFYNAFDSTTPYPDPYSYPNLYPNAFPTQMPTNVIQNPAYVDFPRWEQLTDAQKLYYGNNQTLYTNGTLPWDLLTEEQRILFASNVSYASNKIDDAEKQDGKGHAYIKLYSGPLVEFHSLALSFVNVPGYQNYSVLFRLYKPNEVLVYKGEGALHIFPAVMARIMNQTQDPLYGSQFGVVAPRIPQVLHIDYEFGYVHPPQDLMEAVGIRAALAVLVYINNIMTAGLKGFGVQGFNANFGSGILYEPLKQQLEGRLEELLRPYYRLVMSSW